MRFYFILFVAVYTYLFIRYITGLHILEILDDLISKLFKTTRKHSARQFIINSENYGKMTYDQKQHSWGYKYYSFILELLFAFDFKNKGITVEGFSTALAMIVIVASIVIAVLLRSVFIFFVLPIILFATMLAVLFLISRYSNISRKSQLLDAMDLLCSSMHMGFTRAVEENIAQFGQEIQAPFKKYLYNIQYMNISLNDAVTILNSEIGMLYDDFCKSVKQYEQAKAPGMLRLFAFQINENGKMRLRDTMLLRSTSILIYDYLACIMIMVGLILFQGFAQGAFETFYSNTFGQMILFGIFISALLVFIIVQCVIGKPYKYKEEIK